MDINRVHMVCSARGRDLLCVDNFLYYCESCKSNEYRWVCTSFRDTVSPCSSRLVTLLVDGDSGEPRHRVERVHSEHKHRRWTSDQIAKIFKHAVVLAAEPHSSRSTSSNTKHKCLDEGEEQHMMSKRQRRDDQQQYEGYKVDEGEQQVNQIEVRHGSKEEVNDDNALQLHHRKWSKGNVHTSFDIKKLNMLKTPKGHHLVTVDGCVYRLDGKSMFRSTFRWKCFRSRDLECEARIYTEHSANGQHRIKPIRPQESIHTHEPYSAAKLMALFRLNRFKIVRGTEELNTLKAFDSSVHRKVLSSEADARQDNIDSRKKSPIRVGKFSSSVQSRTLKSASDKPPPYPLRRQQADAVAAKYELVDDPYEALNDTGEDGITKFTFLPSAKGNKVLCVHNFIYHFDSCSPANGRSYWTCLLRRDKLYKCNARITTEVFNSKLRIVKVSGQHLHPDHRDDIQKRLNKKDLVNKLKETMSNEAMMKDPFDDYLEDECQPQRSKYKREPMNSMDENDFSSSSSNEEEENQDLYPEEHIEEEEEEEEEDEEDGEFEVSEQYDDSNAPVTVEHVQVELVRQDDLASEDYDTIDDEDYDENDHRKHNEEKLHNDRLGKPQRRQYTRSQGFLGENPDDIDVNKVSILRSAKGGDLLCVDGFIYHMKSISPALRTYWSCIKAKDRLFKCTARVTTVPAPENGLKVVHISNSHSHPVSENDIKRRLYNEYVKSNRISKPFEVMRKSLCELSSEYADMIRRRKQFDNSKILEEDEDSSIMKLYAVSDGPPSLAVRMTLKALNIRYELKNVDFIAAEHLTDEYAEMNPQREIPVLDDDGFYLSESIAIMQYLCDKYAPDTPLYPKDAKKRAVINHRLCFNMAFYYDSISAHSMAPIFFDYQRTEKSLKKVKNALSVFQTYLERTGTKYAAADHLTIADLALVSATLCLEAIAFDLSGYPLIVKWYKTFKTEYPELWEIANGGMQEIIEFERNPPDLSHMNHPFHPVRKTKAK